MKKFEKEINKKINKALSKSMPKYDFDPNTSEVEVKCLNCNSIYNFDVMKIQFDSLHNKEKFLVEAKCPYCESHSYELSENTMAKLAYLYKNNLMEDTLFSQEYMKELSTKYPKEEIENEVGLDDMGLEALEKGDYNEVFRIFTQFIYLNPNHHLGFEFIAYAYYENRDFERSIYFMGLALERIVLLKEQGKIDSALVAVLTKNYEYMQRRQLIFRWWENL